MAYARSKSILQIEMRCCHDISLVSAPQYVLGDASKITYSNVAQFLFTVRNSKVGGMFGADQTVTVTPMVHDDRLRNVTSHVTPSPPYLEYSYSSVSDQSLSLRTFALVVDLSYARSTTSRYFTLSLLITGPGSKDYNTDNALHTFTIQNVSQVLPPPIVSYVQFDQKDLSVINVHFNADTDYGYFALFDSSKSTWKCSVLLSFTGMEFATCQWITGTCIQIKYCTGILCHSAENRKELEKIFLSPNSHVTLLDGKVRSACQYEYSSPSCKLNFAANEVSVVVQSPINAPTPSISLIASSYGGACLSGIDLDASASSGNTGRYWKSVTWDVSEENGFTMSAVETFLNKMPKIYRLYSYHCSL